MNTPLSIERNTETHETKIHIYGPIAFITIRIKARVNARDRRSIGLAFFRQIRPFLKYFIGAELRHSDDRSSDFERIEERGLFMPRSSDFETPTGKLGFEIRMARLKLGWNQVELSRRSGLNRWHISRIERGLCTPHSGTLKSLEQVLGIPLSQPGPRNAQKVTSALGDTIRYEELRRQEN